MEVERAVEQIDSQHVRHRHLLHSGHEILRNEDGQRFSRNNGTAGKSLTRSRLDGVGGAKEATDKNDGTPREFSKVTYPENEDARTAAYEMLLKSPQTPEEAVTAAFVMISPFSYGDPPLCMS